MLVRCEKCGYENFPQHRYCGMCANELRLPRVAGTPAPAAPLRVPSPVVSAPKKEVVFPAREASVAPKEVICAPVSGPSFLGLGNEAAESSGSSYLLEDETPQHRGRNLILILMIAGVAAAGWHWRQDLRAAVSKMFSSPPPAAKTVSSDTQEANSSAPDATSAPAASTSANAGAQTEKPGTETSGQANAPDGQAQTPPQAQSPPPAAGAADSPQPSQADQAQGSDQSQASQTQPADSAPSTAAAAKPDNSGERIDKPAPARKAGKERTPAVTPSVTRADQLESEGEKYLYGNGVPENCARARTDLLAAAQRSSAQAQNVLGTMYATGHCATRDLPTAYRWFSRSLRKDPNNTRIEQDLRVLWNQMTADERQMALRDQR